MDPADWRSPHEHEGLHDLDAPGFAWEFLRRNPDFKKEHEALRNAERAGRLEPDAADAFACRWGCYFGSDGQDEQGPPKWTAASLPSVVALIAAPVATQTRFANLRTLPDGADFLAPGAHTVDHGGTILRVDVDSTGAAPPAVLLPLDRLFDVRLASAQRLWRSLVGRNPGVNPAALTPARRDRLILALRALDGKLGGASHRQIGAALFERDNVAGRDWISHDLRDRTARLVRFGVTTMKGGYLRLLLHPFRGVPRN